MKLPLKSLPAASRRMISLLAIGSLVTATAFILRASDLGLSDDTPLNGTPTEIAKFYGPVLKHNARLRNHQVLEGSVMDGDLYGKNGFIIRAVYIKGRCVLLEYTRATGSLTFADVNPLLATNAGNSTWEQGKDGTGTTKFYHRLDDKAVAHWTAENDGSLLISVEDGGASLGGGLLQGA